MLQKMRATVENRKVEIEMEIVTVKAICSRCHGTGLYRGKCEHEGAAVICFGCGGSGYEEIEYEPFVERRVLPEGVIKKVFKSVRYGVDDYYPNDHVDNFGRFCKFSQAGCTYEEWLAGKKPLPVKEICCPFMWTKEKLQYVGNDVNGLYESRCSEGMDDIDTHGNCKFYDDQAKCWLIYEECGGQ